MAHVEKLSADAEDWATMAGPACRYPWTHFVEDPKPEELRKHKASLETMIAFGELLHFTTSSPAFPDKQIAAMVKATLGMLQDTLSLWHGNQLSTAEAGEILQKCFPE